MKENYQRQKNKNKKVNLQICIICSDKILFLEK